MVLCDGLQAEIVDNLIIVPSKATQRGLWLELLVSFVAVVEINPWNKLFIPNIQHRSKPHISTQAANAHQSLASNCRRERRAAHSRKPMAAVAMQPKAVAMDTSQTAPGLTRGMVTAMGEKKKTTTRQKKKSNKGKQK